MAKTIERLQVEQCRRDRDLLDRQPHMTLSPEKAGIPVAWGILEGTPKLLSAGEAHSQGFHAGARWGYAYALRRLRRLGRLK